MENRYFSRIIVDIPCVCIEKFGDQSTLEFAGIIHDISESGIQVRIDKNKYNSLADRMEAKDIISFQAHDEYVIVSVNHEDVIQGDAEVVWINSTSDNMSFGCRTNKVLPEYLSYVKNKKIALFLEGSFSPGAQYA